MVYNLISCAGWETVTSIGLSFGTCMLAKLMVIVLFFVLALIRKWGVEMSGLSYSFVISIVAGMVGYLIVVTFLGNPGISFAIGLVAGLAGGYFGGMFLPDEVRE